MKQLIQKVASKTLLHLKFANTRLYSKQIRWLYKNIILKIKFLLVLSTNSRNFFGILAVRTNQYCSKYITHSRIKPILALRTNSIQSIF